MADQGLSISSAADINDVPTLSASKTKRSVRKQSYSEYSDDNLEETEHASMTATGCNSDNRKRYHEATRVVTHAASVADVVAIEEMLQRGYGVVGHADCKLELLDSRLGPAAGRGLFVKADCVISRGECITEYTGKHIAVNNVRKCSIEEQLYNIEVDDVCINGHMNPIAGQGFGSFVNSAVAGGYANVVRLVVYQGRIFFMCNVDERYPIRGGFEVYFTAGVRWWNLYNEVSNSKHDSKQKK